MCEAEVGTSPNGVHLGLCALLLACAFPSLTDRSSVPAGLTSGLRMWIFPHA